MTEAELEQLVAQIAEEILSRVSPAVPVATPLPAPAPDPVSPPAPALSPQAIAALIDHTILRPDATAADVRQLCAEARHHRFAAVCVNPYWVPLAARELRGTPVQVCTVVGFPLGATTTASKCAEAAEAISLGATEIDMVLNVGALKAGDLAAVQADIAAVAATCHRAGALLKVILETALLSDPEKIAACHASQNAGADFVKTSTGFAKSGATPADVALLRATVGPSLGVKASGGIRSLADLQAMAAAGASRIGASASVHILAQAGQP